MTNISNIKSAALEWFSEASATIKHYGCLCGRKISEGFSSFKDSPLTQNIFNKSIEVLQSSRTFVVENKKILAAVSVATVATLAIAVIASRLFKNYKVEQQATATEITDLRTANQALTNEKGGLANQLNQLEAEKNSLQETNTALTGRVDDLIIENDDLKRKKSKAEQQVETLQGEKQQLESDKTDLTNQLEEAKQQIIQLNANLSPKPAEQPTGWFRFLTANNE